MVVALAIWALARLLDVELTAGKGAEASAVGAGDVLVTALLAGLAAWGVHALLVRRGVARWWPFVGSTALAVSVIGPTWLADGLAAVVLIAMHLAAGAVGLGVLQAMPCSLILDGARRLAGRAYLRRATA